MIRRPKVHLLYCGLCAGQCLAASKPFEFFFPPNSYVIREAEFFILFIYLLLFNLEVSPDICAKYSEISESCCYISCFFPI